MPDKKTTKERAALGRLARLYGVQTSYFDVRRRRREASPESLLAALRALGAPLAGLGDVAAALRQRRLETWSRPLEPVFVAWNGSAGPLPLRLPAEEVHGRAACRLFLEDGRERSWRLDLNHFTLHKAAAVEGLRYIVTEVALPQGLPAGYHRFQVELRGKCQESLLIAAPLRVYSSPARTWGLFVPAYALRTQDNWGVGDFSDFEALEKWVKDLGGGVVSTLPFLASFLDGNPFDPSPYSPASRLFWNEFYLDPRREEEFRDCAAAQRLVRSEEMQRAVEAMRKAPLADYRRLMRLKRRVLEKMADWLVRHKSARYAAFRRAVDSRPALEDYARFRAVTERRGAPWIQWPEPLHSGTLREEDGEERSRLYHLYVQWLAGQRVAALAENARRSGPGLHLDFPLGVHPHGYDVWRERDAFALDASGGAPPDAVFTNGQNWGFPPLHPEGIRRQGYRYWIACLRQQMAHAGLLRIDHVMGLHRLFWIPQGCEAASGVYVRYRAEEFYAILSLESHRHKTEIIGENLGTVPGYVNAALARHGVQKMFVVEYEIRPDAERPLRPVPGGAVASLNTHDMAPFAAFLEGDDIEDLRRQGLFSGAEARRENSNRRKMRRALAAFLARKRHAAVSLEDAELLLQESLRWLASSAAKVVLVNLEDLWMETEPQNMPGTGAERPNWTRKTRHTMEEFCRMPEVLHILDELNRLRHGGQRVAQPRRGAER